MRWEFSVLAEGRHIFGRRPKLREKLFRAGHHDHEDLTETGNRARKVSGTQGRVTCSSGPGYPPWRVTPHIVVQKFDWSQTLRNNMKQGVQTQQVTSNNVASVCSGLNSHKVIYDIAVLSR